MVNFISYIPEQMNLILYGTVFLVLNYVVMSILLMKLAEKKNLKNRWLSWVPIGNLWILGKIIESFLIGKKRFNDAEYRLTTSSVVFLLVAKIPVIGLLVGVAYMILVASCAIEFAKIIAKRFIV
ncbi:MAG: conserved rane protein of unknown function [Clostridiales bacterium]|jgi:hypothetical protein|nr:conserved rane protein of unknown function [Clostridiales bacterium]